MRLYFILFLICFYSCDKKNNVTTYRLAKPATSLEVKKTNNELPSRLNFSWESPESWEEGKKSSMRLASYSIPFSNGFADLSITNFSGDGGGVLSNVNRWRQQINLPNQSLEMIKENVIIAKSNLGNYEIHKMINFDNEDTAFLCSILSVKNSTIFVKMSSTKNGIEELEKQFMDFCSSFSYSK